MKNSNFKQLTLWVYDLSRPSQNALMHTGCKILKNIVSNIYVSGYPKSGTTWITKMVADYLEVPFLGASSFAVGKRGIIHSHWNYNPAWHPAIYVVRDGRDVAISVYMNVMKNYIARSNDLAELGKYSITTQIGTSLGRHAKVHKRLYETLGKQFDPWDISTNLPRFLEAEFSEPFIPEAKLCWPQHVNNWRGRDGVLMVKYEDMLHSPVDTLSALLKPLASSPLDLEKIHKIVEHYSFVNQTGRRPGEESRNSFARKGIHGDWRNYFTSESAQLFYRYAGDLLIELGYENDNSWLNVVDIK